MNYLDIVSNQKTLELKFGEGVLHIKYDATKLNKENSIVSQEDTTLYIDYLADFLSKVIVEWDLTMEEKPIDISKKELIKLNMSFLDYLFKQINKDEDAFFQGSK